MKLKTATLDASHLWAFAAIIVVSLLTALAAWIRIPLPFTPVPITLQTLVVLMGGAILGSRNGAIAQLAYLGYGLAGFPVFSGGTFGFAILAGPTGGYLLAFPVAAWLTGFLIKKYDRFYFNVSMLLLASLPILLLGTLQLSYFTGQDFLTALTLGAIPFIAGDFVKCAAGAGLLRFFIK